MGYYWEWDHVKYVVVRPDGTIRKVVEVPVPGPIMLHDVGITDSSILIFDLPVTFQLDALGERLPVPVPVGPRPPRPGRGAAPGGHGRRRPVGRRRAVLRVPPDERLRPAGRADRDGRGPAPADVRHRLQRPGRGRADAWTAGRSTRPPARCWRSASTTAARSSPASTSGWSASRTATATAPTFTTGPITHGDLLKHDLETRHHHRPQLRRRARDGRGRVRPPSDDAAEDDGWVMSLVHDQSTDRSDLVILDAQDFAGEPVATVHLRSGCPSASTATGCRTPDTRIPGDQCSGSVSVDGPEDAPGDGSGFAEEAHDR